MESRLECREAEIPLSGAEWAAKSEAYASLISEHLGPDTVWLDAGCGWRLLENDLEPLENWLVDRCGLIVGMDCAVKTHRNISLLVQGFLDALPFADNSIDLITCNMVVEHLDDPAQAFGEIARCLSPGGALIVKTPNLLNYGVSCNAIASKILPERWRLRLVHRMDGRQPEDFFPVRYKANTVRSLVRVCNASGLQVHKTIGLPAHRPYLQKMEMLEQLLRKLTPICALLVCAHKPSAD